MAIPTVLVSGGLGSGKTTLLKAIVSANPEYRFGIVVNEFGEMGVDGDLLRPLVPEIVEIRNGCICCATQDQLAPAVRELIRTFKIDILLLEMSGVAEPLPVIHELRILAPLVEIRSHAVLVDGTADLDLGTRERSFRNALATADVMVVTKVDLCKASELASWSSFLEARNRRAVLVPASHGKLPLRMLLDTSPRDEGDQFGPKAAFHDPKLHRFTTICRFVNSLASADIRSFVLMHGDKIGRIKGIAQVDGDWAEVQAVRGDLRITPFSGTVPRRGRLVFISNKLYQTELIKVVSDVFDTHVDAAV